MGKKIRVLVLGVALLATLLFTAAPAHAAVDAGVATADGPVPWLLTAECSITAGATTDARTITYVFQASAQAEGPAVGTQVSCHLYNQFGSKRGSCSNALPGAAAACVGTATMNIGDIPQVCVTASALYATGTASLPPCP